MLKYVLSAFLVLAQASVAFAHFGMVIPSSSVVEEKSEQNIKLTLSFSHPMEGQGMPLVKPAAFSVTLGDKSTDLLASLKETKVMEHQAWQSEYTIKRPGVYTFAMTPQPYWEPAEDCFIIHYTKTIISAFGSEEGWQEPLGLKTEIVPLTRPFGNYAGNVFQGQVLLDGKPVPNAEVEVEFYNKDKAYKAPNGTMITQVVRADAQGVFTYAVPFAGWWGFAALNTAEQTLQHEGQAKDVELGAVLWLEFVAPVRMQ